MGVRNADPGKQLCLLSLGTVLLPCIYLAPAMPLLGAQEPGSASLPSSNLPASSYRRSRHPLTLTLIN